MLLPASASTSAARCLDFINASPSPFHAVAAATNLLQAAGFALLDEGADWANAVRPGEKLIVTRNQSSLVAVSLGASARAGSGFSIVGAHTDSPCLKLKPTIDRSASQSGYSMCNVQPYGGGLWHTWFDRDLGVAGRAIVEAPDANANGGKRLVSRLFDLREPLLRVPTLAIHLDRDSRDKFSFSTETHLRPLCGSRDPEDDAASRCPLREKIEAAVRVNAQDQVVDVDGSLYDITPGTIGGDRQEYMFVARCDNLVMSYAATQALCEAVTGPSSTDANRISVVALFDHEEVGSNSAYGAGSRLLLSVLRRVSSALAGPTASALGLETAFERAIANSYVISADMAHAIHPNYAEKHDSEHAPKMNKGVVVKHNANQRYATTAATAALLRALASRCEVPLQDFTVRNDMACGSTIGPIIATGLGLRVVDIGNPQLSMHSIREQAGTQDVAHAITLLKEFYTSFSKVDVRNSISEM